jgi:hypothetical protein
LSDGDEGSVDVDDTSKSELNEGSDKEIDTTDENTDTSSDGAGDMSNDNADTSGDNIEITEETNELPEDGDLSDDGSDELSDDNIANSGKDIECDYNDLSDKSRHNDTPYEDSRRAFEYVDSKYSKESPTWQECANRQVELNQSMIDSLKPRYDELVRQRDNIDKQLYDYIHDNDMTPEKCASDPVYQDLLAQRQPIDKQCVKLDSQICQYQSQIDSVACDINPEMKTTFKGFNDSNFNDAYNGYITQQQGHARADVQGCCGIDGSISKINQQNGTLLNEKDGVKECLENKWCDYQANGKPKNNGGTNYAERTKFLNEHGLTNERVEGAYRGKGDPITLKEIANRFNNGESCGLMLKAQDLSQEDLSTRKNTISDWFKNEDQKSANHATTIAGFSYNAKGDISGVWLNDTGGWAKSNRVYISSDKFAQMQQNTKGFAVEYSKRRLN